MEKIKVGLIGVGNVGMILAVKLQEAGCEMHLCERDKIKKEKILEEGIVLENVIQASARFEHVYTTIEEMANLDLDYLIFTLKSYQTEEAVKQAEALNSAKLTVISAQNGIDVEKILSASFTESKTLRMVVNFAGNAVSQNSVKVTFFNPPNYIGSLDDSRKKEAEKFADMLNGVSLQTTVVDSFELLERAWEKTILNASLSALCAVGKLTMGEAMSDPDTVELIEQTINEGIEVAKKEKIKFPDNFLRKCLRYLKKGGDHYPSLAVDLLNNRPTEIDYMNGKLVEYGRKHYVRTTLNLSFTNMVKAMTNKNVIPDIVNVTKSYSTSLVKKGMVDTSKMPIYYKGVDCYLGIDLGSAYSKFTITDEAGTPIFQYALRSLNKDRDTFKHLMNAIHTHFSIKYSCATGYGRKHFIDSDIIKTEVNCATTGVSKYFSGAKNILDIGGEDIKIIKCNDRNGTESFYMNEKCSAGTGSFLEEIAERANIKPQQMSGLASNSEYDQELNSFCTVFAKTEIMNWIFDGLTSQDISRGVYLSIANRVSKMRLAPGLPIYMIGGVIAHHPYFKVLLSQKLEKSIEIVENPQYIVSLGAALTALKDYKRSMTVNSGPLVSEASEAFDA
ncbi:MAG: 2-dehydropantoate 2-reductase [Saprospirales bacterium]|nr:2-dehydropantoate 2-reductase [Saprospirales bacterium]